MTESKRRHSREHRLRLRQLVLLPFAELPVVAWCGRPKDIPKGWRQRGQRHERRTQQHADITRKTQVLDRQDNGGGVLT